MAKKDYAFELLVPLRLEHYVDIRNLNEKLKLISFQIDLERNYCKIFARTKKDKFIIETVHGFFLNYLADENFDFFDRRVISSMEDRLNGLQKKNEKKLEPKELSAWSRCKKNKLG